MEKSEGGNFNFPPYNKKLQSDTDTSVTAVAAPASSSSSDIPAAKKLARQLDFTVLGGRGGGVGGGGGGMSATMSTSSVLLQTQQQQQQQQQRVVLPMPRPQAEITTTATAQVALTMPPMLQAQSPHPYTVRPVKPESPKSRPRPNADIKDGTPKRAKQCNCKHSKCLKLYCECFASGIYCDGCNCVNCYNNVENEVARREAVEATLERNPNAFRPKIASSPHGSKDSKVEAGELIILAKHNKGCHCKKSGCLKKYCECFQANILCSDNCKCVECKNQEGSEERQALFRGEHGNNFVYIQQAANAAITGAIGSSGYGSLPVSKKRKAQEALFGTTAKDAHRLAQLQQANHNKGQGHCSTIPNARNGNASSLGHSKFTYRSLLADIIQPQDLTELCSVLVVVSQAAKTLAAQKRVEDETETSLASSIQRKSDNQKETDADKSVTEGFTSRNQDIKSGPDDSSSEGADLPKSRPMSPATLALMCDEQDTMFMAASSRRARGQDRNMPSQSPFDQAMRDVYAEQERIVLTKFRDCLTRLITVGEIKETKCSSLARSEQGNPKEPVNNGVTKPTTMIPNVPTSAIAANHSNQHSRSLPPVSENTALKPKIENDV